MNVREFYDYIIENFTLDGTSGRMLDNILNYIADQGFTNDEDCFKATQSLLDGTIGLEEHELRMFKPTK